MEIRRALSKGANWSVKLSQIPALLELIDEQQIPVDICLTHGTGRVALRAESVYCRRCGRHLKLEGPGNLIEIDLERLAEARAVSRASGAKRRISLQLLGHAGTALLTITGPQPGTGYAAQVWQLVMESLLPAIPASRSSKAPVSPVPRDADDRQEFHPRLQRLHGRPLPGARREDLPAWDFVAMARPS
jgi:hypothetical protein